MKKLQPMQLSVIKITQLSANMLRITLQGDALVDFPEDCEGGYIKLLFNVQGNSDLKELGDNERPVMRTYTIATYSQSKSTIDVDFVSHSTSDLTCGFAARWATNTFVGDKISIAGPSLLIDINPNADWFFMVADMTALPALSVKIAKLPHDAKGYAVIKVIDRKDIRALATPENIQVLWLIGDEPLSSQVRILPWLPGVVSVWVACEFESMRALRTYFRNEKAVQKEHIYISSYWKQGLTEDGHKVIKREDARKGI
jgi:NADPH-dependent ferric siderophore reductase